MTSYTRATGGLRPRHKRLAPWPLMMVSRLFRCPMAWMAGPNAIRARRFWAAEKPWNRSRRKVAQ